MGVLGGGEMGAPDPVLEDERPGADRVVRAVGALELLGGGHGAHLGGHVGVEGHPGLLHLDRHRERVDLVDGGDRVQRGPGEACLAVGVEVVYHVVGGEGVAVGERHAGAQLDRPFPVVGVVVQGLGQVGVDLSVLAERGERVEDGEGVHGAPAVPAVLARVHARAPRALPDREASARLGRALRGCGPRLAAHRPLASASAGRGHQGHGGGDGEDAPPAREASCRERAHGLTPPRGPRRRLPQTGSVTGVTPEGYAHLE